MVNARLKGQILLQQETGELGGIVSIYWIGGIERNIAEPGLKL